MTTPRQRLTDCAVEAFALSIIWAVIAALNSGGARFMLGVGAAAFSVVGCVAVLLHYTRFASPPPRPEDAP
jgi:hypothetical protein